MINTTPLLRLYARRRRSALEMQDATLTQRAQLGALVRQTADTRFGRTHDFPALREVSDYRHAVPIRHYEEFWRK